MIAHVAGRVTDVGPSSAVVEVGGVGLLVQCSPATLARLTRGQEAWLATSLVVREDSLTLFGFTSDEERSLFELVQTASGVGPRLAQAMLAVLPPSELRRAIAAGDITALTAVPGVGKKGAQRLTLELKDRIGPVDGDSAARANSSGASSMTTQVASGLVALGWSPAQAEKAAADAVSAATEAGEPIEAPLLLKRAIALLGSAR